MFLPDQRLLIVTIVSVVATLISCGALVYFAKNAGLDPVRLTGDANGYVKLAYNLLNNGVFSIEPVEPFFPQSFRTPGYPTFLAGLLAIFSSEILVLFVQGLIVSAAAPFLYLLFRPYHERGAFWGSLIFALEPVHLFLSASFLSDALFTTLFLLSLLLLEYVRLHASFTGCAVVGVVSGLLILVRPIAILLPLLYALYLIVRYTNLRKAILGALLVCVFALLTVFPWAYRNHRHFGSWSLSSVSSFNLVFYNASEFLKWKPNDSAKATLDAFRTEQGSLNSSYAFSLYRAGAAKDIFVQTIGGHEIEYALFHVAKTIPFFISDGLRDTIRLFKVDLGTPPNITTAVLRGDIATVFSYVTHGGLGILLLAIGSGFWAVILLLFGFESIRALVRREWFPTLFIITLVAYFALLTGPVSNARYRLPVEGFILVFASISLVRWYDTHYPGISPHNITIVDFSLNIQARCDILRCMSKKSRFLTLLDAAIWYRAGRRSVPCRCLGCWRERQSCRGTIAGTS